MNSKSMGSSAKEIAKEYTNTLWNTKDVDIIDRLINQEVVVHSPFGDFHGVKALKEVARSWLKGFPDLQVENELIINENDLVSILWKAKGTHQGEFKGKKPTGRPISYSGVTVYRIRNGQITEYWAYIDMQHLLSQIEL